LLFNSYQFVFVFLPLLLVGYELLALSGARRAVPLFLVLGSLFFYGWWDWRYLFLFGSSIAFNYSWAQALRPRGAADTDRRFAPRAMLGVGVATNLGLLGYFKYRNFFVSSVAAVAGRHWAMAPIVLPLAISFFTFEQITYLTSAWRGEIETRDFLSYALFITFFPHLIAGPIVRYGQIFPQLNRASRYRLDADNLSAGLMIFAIGLFKKVMIADTFKVWLDPIFDTAVHPGFVDAWAATLAFAFEIYFDFSGYTDMAIGLARMLNVRFPENFDSPYKAHGPIEFWRRWHITLSFFLRDYLYIPLGGNRHGKLRQHFNLFATMLLGGLWHGADWTFVMWGAFHGIALSANHLWRDRKLSMAPALAWMLTFIFVTLAWVLFRTHSIEGAIAMFSGMAGLNGFGWAGGSVGPPELRQCLAGLFLVLCCPNRQTIMSWQWRSDYLYAAAFAALAGTSLLQMSNPPPFIYFQF
jgi:alginate O-acetyltransferase complex protein AlgI